MREAKLRVKRFQIFIFDAKLRFALFASLRLAIFSKIYVDNKLVIFPARVNPWGCIVTTMVPSQCSKFWGKLVFPCFPVSLVFWELLFPCFLVSLLFPELLFPCFPVSLLFFFSHINYFFLKFLIYMTF